MSQNDAYLTELSEGGSSTGSVPGQRMLFHPETRSVLNGWISENQMITSLESE